jgi:DNA polymerase-3 subunit delta'
MTLTGFDQIFGQSHAIDWLCRAYLGDRMPHGLIFAGPVGVGKATTARALSALFLCQEPKSTSPCNGCASCTTLAAGNHPDYHLITKELIRAYDATGTSKGIDLSIKVIRPELVDAAGRKSSMGRGKVFIIKQAELMSVAAQNAMLKTLEEPLGRTLIVLLTDQPDSLLLTIRSRCQVVRFWPLANEIVLRELENRDIPRGDAADAAAFADGSLGLALRWLKDGVIAHARELRQTVDQLLGGYAPADLPGWLKAVAEEYAQKQLERDELSSKDQATREGIGLYLHLMSQMFRRRLPPTSSYEELEGLCSAIDAIARADQYLDSNVNIALIFQQLAVTLEKLLSTPSSGTTAGLRSFDR